MSSTRKLTCLLGLSACSLAIFTGCARKNYAAKDELNPTPILEDDAMRQRQWTQSNALYPSGVVPAGPTLFEYEPRRQMNQYRYYYADIGVFALNTALLPYQGFKTPPWREAYYRGAWIEPSYTANPPTPPSVSSEPPLPAPAFAEPTTRPGR